MPLPHPLVPFWREQFEALVERNRHPGDSDKAACRRLAPKLSVGREKPWSAEYLLHIFHRSQSVKASKAFQAAVLRYVENRRRKARKDKLRVYVPVESEAERQRINQLLSAEDKRAALLIAAYFEED